MRDPRVDQILSNIPGNQKEPGKTSICLHLIVFPLFYIYFHILPAFSHCLYIVSIIFEQALNKLQSTSELESHPYYSSSVTLENFILFQKPLLIIIEGIFLFFFYKIALESSRQVETGKHENMSKTTILLAIDTFKTGNRPFRHCRTPEERNR